MEGVVILFSDDGDFDVVDIFYEEDVKSFIVIGIFVVEMLNL